MSSKRLSPADVVQALAQKTGMPIEQIKILLQAQAELAYAHAADGFAIPGIGVLIEQKTAERKLVMQFGPRSREEITIPAKRRLKFRISKVAKDMACGTVRSLPDLFPHYTVPEFKFSSDATKLSEASMFTSVLGSSLTLARDGKPASLVVYRLPDLWVPSGQIVAADMLIGEGDPYSRSIPPGRYPLGLVIARIGTDERIAFAILRFSDAHIERWEMAVTADQDISKLRENEIFGYGVDSGTGGFCDLSAQQHIREANEADTGFYEQVIDELKNTYKNTRDWTHIESPSGSIAIFSSGYGDGCYASYFGLDDAGNAAALVTDFKVVNWR